MPSIIAFLLVIAIGAAVLKWRFALLDGALRAAREAEQQAVEDAQQARAEASQARLGEQRFRALAEHGGQVGWIVDCGTLQLLYLSPGGNDLFGPGAAGDYAMLQMLAGDLGPRLALLAGGDSSQRQQFFEFEHPHPDGAMLPVEVSSTVVDDAGGKPALLVGTIRDIRARRAQEQAQKKFASMISHEFRTPLATIDGAIQRLEMTAAQAGADEATRKRYGKIQLAVDRLLGMINEYLSPERMASIGRQRHPNEVAPQALLDGAVAAAGLAGRQITVSAAGLPARIRCDPEGMRLSLQVLLENAGKYTPPGTPIEVRGGIAPEGGLEFVVADHGPGVREDEMARLFEKGYRGRDAAGQPGSGLGLYMARAVLEVHGGTLSVKNAPAAVATSALNGGAGDGAMDDAPHAGRNGVMGGMDGMSGAANGAANAIAHGAGGAEFRIWLPIAADSGKNLASDDCNSDNSPTHAVVNINTRSS